MTRNGEIEERMSEPPVAAATQQSPQRKNNVSNNKYNDTVTLLRKATETSIDNPLKTDVTMLRAKTIVLPFRSIHTGNDDNAVSSSLNFATGSSASCNLCKIPHFPNGVIEQRLHFRSDWHLVNLSLSERGKPIVTEEESRDYMRDEDENASTSSSSTSSSDSVIVHNDGEDARQQDGSTTVCVLEGSLCVRMSATVARDDAELQELMTCPQVWGIILYRSGHFAAAIFHDGKLKEHKSEHRYTQRKKQGGSQAAHDSKGSKAKSAGAQLRRYGEQTMRERVAKVMSEWDWNKCTRVFMAVPERARRLFVISSKGKAEKNDARFAFGDDRVRRIPFMTNRPTLEECERVFHVLEQVEFFPVPPPPPPTSAVEAASPLSTVVVAHKSLQEIEQEKERDETARFRSLGYEDLAIHTACLNDDVNGVVEALDRDVNAKSFNGDTPLHLACEHGAMQVLQTLLDSRKADLTIKDLLGRVPYQRARDAAVRTILRTYRAERGDDSGVDWNKTLIPEPVKDKSEDELRAKKEKEKEKKKRQAERKRQEKQEKEQLAREEEEQRKQAELMALVGTQCPECKKTLPLKKKDRFAQGEEEFCSALCMRNRTRKLVADAAEKRMQKS